MPHVFKVEVRCTIMSTDGTKLSGALETFACDEVLPNEVLIDRVIADARSILHALLPQIGQA